MSKRHYVPISDRIPVAQTERIPVAETERSRDVLLVASAVGVLLFLFFILPLIRIGLGEPPT